MRRCYRWLAWLLVGWLPVGVSAIGTVFVVADGQEYTVDLQLSPAQTCPYDLSSLAFEGPASGIQSETRLSGVMNGDHLRLSITGQAAVADTFLPLTVMRPQSDPDQTKCILINVAFKARVPFCVYKPWFERENPDPMLRLALAVRVAGSEVPVREVAYETRAPFLPATDMIVGWKSTDESRAVVEADLVAQRLVITAVSETGLEPPYGSLPQVPDVVIYPVTVAGPRVDMGLFVTIFDRPHKPGGEESVVLYRGMQVVGRPDTITATAAEPLHGHRSPRLHANGHEATALSSWTTSGAVAVKFAGRDPLFSKKKAVVVRRQFLKTSPQLVSTWSRFTDESEMLVVGAVTVSGSESVFYSDRFREVAALETSVVPPVLTPVLWYPTYR